MCVCATSVTSITISGLYLEMDTPSFWWFPTCGALYREKRKKKFNKEPFDYKN